MNKIYKQQHLNSSMKHFLDQAHICKHLQTLSLLLWLLNQHCEHRYQPIPIMSKCHKSAVWHLIPTLSLQFLKVFPTLQVLFNKTMNNLNLIPSVLKVDSLISINNL